MNEKLLDDLNKQMSELIRLQQANLFANFALNPALSEEARLNFTKEAIFLSRTVNDVNDVLKNPEPQLSESPFDVGKIL